MSIASEIADLNTNINSLKTAIVAKGGTVAEGAGLNSLASSVAEMPAGGETIWADVDTEWGGVFYWNKYDTNYVTDNKPGSGGVPQGCTVNSIDSAKFATFKETAQLEDMMGEGFQFNYSENWDAGDGSYAWSVSTMEGDLWLTTEELLTQAGISVTLPTGATFASFGIVEKKTPASDAETVFGELTQSELDALLIGESGDPTLSVAGVSVPGSMFRRFVFGQKWSYYGTAYTTTGTGYIGDQFLSGTGVECISADKHGIIGTISAQFLSGCDNFNSRISFPEVTTIGVNFLSGCLSLNSPISFPIDLPKLQTIGAGCFSDMGEMVALIDLGSVQPPSSVSDNGALTAMRSTYPAYTTGISITGSTASAWKTKYPDFVYPGDSSARKLIVVAQNS